MAKRRKSVDSRLDEVDRGLHSTFSNTASAISQLYTQSMNQQKLSFHAGERYAMESMYQWILEQQGDGRRVRVDDVVSRLQNEIDFIGEDTSASSRLSAAHLSSGIQASSICGGQTPGGNSPRPRHFLRTKNATIPNVVSGTSPRRCIFQNHQFGQGGECPASENWYMGSQNPETSSPNQNTDVPWRNSNDSSMDMN